MSPVKHIDIPCISRYNVREQKNKRRRRRIWFFAAITSKQPAKAGDRAPKVRVCEFTI